MTSTPPGRIDGTYFFSIGAGALGHLDSAGINGWYGPTGVPASELIDRLDRGELPRAEEANEPGRRGGRQGRRPVRGQVDPSRGSFP